MNLYKCLNNQIINYLEYSIVPIRFEDRFKIMKWRNEQMYHLRQTLTLTNEMQDAYFSNVIKSLYEEEEPSQILFSYLKSGKCIGYGGLVHINWADKNAEISFIMATELEKESFQSHWCTFLKLIEICAFGDLHLHKIYTYAFDLRPKLYLALLESNYIEQVKLKEHCFFQDKFIDIVIHSKFKKC
jgi:RimJ/RimL family protein N-acetyltransferase